MNHEKHIEGDRSQSTNVRNPSLLSPECSVRPLHLDLAICNSGKALIILNVLSQEFARILAHSGGDQLVLMNLFQKY